MSDADPLVIYKVTVFQQNRVGDYAPRTETVVRDYLFSTEEKAQAFADTYQRWDKYEKPAEVFAPCAVRLDTGRPL